MQLSDRQQMEINLEQARELIERKNEVEQLMQHPLFKKVILEEYCEKEGLRLIEVLSEPHMQEPHMREGVIRDMHAISALQYYLMDAVKAGKGAEAAMPSYLEEEALVESEEEDGAFA